MFKIPVVAPLLSLLFPNNYLRFDANDQITVTNVGTTTELILGPCEYTTPNDREATRPNTRAFLILTPEKRDGQLGPVIVAPIVSDATIDTVVAGLQRHHNGASYRAVAVTHHLPTAEKALDALGKQMPQVSECFVAQTSQDALVAVLDISKDGTVTGTLNTRITPYRGLSRFAELRTLSVHRDLSGCATS